MIDFKGELTCKGRKYVLRKRSNMLMLVWTVVAIIILPFAFYVAKILGMLFFWFYILMCVAVLIIFALPAGKIDQKSFMPVRIFFDLRDEIVVKKSETTESFHEISSIKAVYDYGDWYYLKFYASDRDLYFVCQKDLLVEGTIEEFEAMFADKIIRKV